jgi:hypothetical protein
MWQPWGAAMELATTRGIFMNDATMTGQGKNMPGIAALGSDDKTAPQGDGAKDAAALPGTDAFDSWLRAELGRLYDNTLTEPVPPDMLRLLNGATKR